MKKSFSRSKPTPVSEWTSERAPSPWNRDPAIGIVFVGHRVAEIREESVTEKLRDRPTEPVDDLAAHLLVAQHQLAQILGIELV